MNYFYSAKAVEVEYDDNFIYMYNTIIKIIGHHSINFLANWEWRTERMTAYYSQEYQAQIQLTVSCVCCNRENDLMNIHVILLHCLPLFSHFHWSRIRISHTKLGNQMSVEAETLKRMFGFEYDNLFKSFERTAHNVINGKTLLFRI